MVWANKEELLSWEELSYLESHIYSPLSRDLCAESMNGQVESVLLEVWPLHLYYRQMVSFENCIQVYPDLQESHFKKSYCFFIPYLHF